MNRNLFVFCIIAAIALQATAWKGKHGNPCQCPKSWVRKQYGCGGHSNNNWGGHSNNNWGGYSNNNWGGHSNNNWGGHSNNNWNNGPSYAQMYPAVATPMGSGTCRDQPDNTCLNRMPGWMHHTCGYAKDWCSSPQYMAAARECCPYTCNACGSSMGGMGMGVAVTTATGSGTCADQPDNTCLTNKAGWVQFTCSYARDWCDSPQYMAAARECCPQTCGVCAGVKSIVDNAVATPDLSTLVAVLTDPRYADILGVVSGYGPMTVFAPTNSAFAAAGVDINDVNAVKNILKYHVVAGAAVKSTDLQPYQQVQTAQGQSLDVRKASNGVTVNDAYVVVADVVSSNGVVHVIDRVLVPASRVAKAAPMAANNMNNMMYQPQQSVAAKPSVGLKSIVENAIATPDLSTLVTVLTLPEFKPILEALSGDGPFTVFAPTNAAFEKANVDVSSTALVAEVLKYHVLAGANVASGDLSAMQFVPTLQGEEMFIRKKKNTVRINGDANVLIADVLSSNGVVHVVDSVLIPPSLN